jgi:hypothetical protein
MVDGRAGVEKDRVAVFDEFGRPPGDLSFRRLFDTKTRGKSRAVSWMIVGWHTPAAYALKVALVCECIQVIADRPFGDVQETRNIFDPDAGLIVE